MQMTAPQPESQALTVFGHATSCQSTDAIVARRAPALREAMPLEGKVFARLPCRRDHWLARRFVNIIGEETIC